MKKIFIDGSAGTTGLRIKDRLEQRKDLSLIILDEQHRKDEKSRKEAINSSDVTFLCLPDDAAREAAGFAENKNTVIIDTSTAHRTNDEWTYGFPELTGQSDKIANSKRIANPGCHASGFISLIAPLTEQGILKKEATLSCFSLTGYSGGGKKMIADYESDTEGILSAPRMYALGQGHKHLPEMVKICGLKNAPAFCPVVFDGYSGMQVTVPIFKKDILGGIKEIKEIYKNYYTGKIIKFKENADESGFMSSNKYSNSDGMEISVFGNDERILLVSRFDNLGKGASGSAIQNLNIVLGIDESEGLTLEGDLK